MSPRIAIVGGGISGLATAYHLTMRLPSASIIVLEAGPRPGGTIWTERLEGFKIEVGANGFLDNKPSTLDLCRALGLGSRLLAASAAAKRRYLFLHERLQPLPESLWGLARTPLLSWRSKMAVLTERLRRPGHGLPEESVHDFVARRTSREIADTFADALVTGVYAGDPRNLSAEAAFPRLVAMEREHGSVQAGMKAVARERRSAARARGESTIGGSQLRSFREGLRLLIETLVGALRQPPRCSTPIEALIREDGHWVIPIPGGSLTADVVVLSCPSHQQARIVAGLDGGLAAAMARIPYAPVVVAALGFRQSDVPNPLDGFGYVIPGRERGDVLGVQWCSSIFPDRAPAGHVLLRILAGGVGRPEVVDWDDATLLQAVRRHLAKSLGIQASPSFQHFVRWRQAIPQYVMGHLDLVRRIEELAARHPGLFLAGNAYHGVAMNDCTEHATRLAERITQWLNRVREEASVARPLP